MDVFVIGAGVTGLTTAIVLAEAGHQVRLGTNQYPQKTTSGAAGAIWHPISAAGDAQRLEWARRTGQVFEHLRGQPETGVTALPLVEGVTEEPVDDWQELHPDLRPARYVELPSGYSLGYHYTTSLIEPYYYLEYLWNRLRLTGATLRMGKVQNLDWIAKPDRVVVNCTGVWAGKIVDDPLIRPVRGQVILLEPQPQLTHGVHISGGPLGLTYILPRSRDCLLGGTQELDEWSERATATVEADIWRRCLRVMPSLGAASVVGRRVGLRPSRESVRLEVEERENGAVIHNYGHGGLGYTLSWGCAQEVLSLLQEL